MCEDDNPKFDEDEKAGTDDFEGEPVPSDAIGISDAYHFVLDAYVPELPTIYSMVDNAEESSDYALLDAALLQLGHVQQRTHELLRSELSSGDLHAYIEHPQFRSHILLSNSGWSVPRPDALGPILHNYSHYESNPPHPDATIDGKESPIFLIVHDFAAWMQRKFPLASSPGADPKENLRSVDNAPEMPARVGRPLNSGYQRRDQVLLAKMAELIEEGKANSPTAAANAVVHEAAGGGTHLSKVRRLERGYGRSRWAKKQPAPGMRIDDRAGQR